MQYETITQACAEGSMPFAERSKSKNTTTHFGNTESQFSKRTHQATQRANTTSKYRTKQFQHDDMRNPSDFGYVRSLQSSETCWHPHVKHHFSTRLPPHTNWSVIHPAHISCFSHQTQGGVPNSGKDSRRTVGTSDLLHWL